MFKYWRLPFVRKSITAIRFLVKYGLRFRNRSFDVELLFDLKLLLEEVELLFHLELLLQVELLI